MKLLTIKEAQKVIFWEDPDSVSVLLAPRFDLQAGVVSGRAADSETAAKKT